MRNNLINSKSFSIFSLQTFRHGFPHAPTAMAYDPIQKLLVIGDNSGSLRMYPFEDDDHIIVATL